MSLWFSLALALVTPAHASYETAVAQVRKYISDEAPTLSEERHATQFIDQGKKTPRAVLVLHGLHESPDYMKAYVDHFAREGSNVIALLFPGHHRKDSKLLSHTTGGEWMRVTREVFGWAKELGDQVEIVGYSTGGTLAAYLALLEPQPVRALYLVAPAWSLTGRIIQGNQTAGLTSINTDSLCGNRLTGMVCKAVANSDREFALMQREGIDASPFAGAQVQVVIEEIQKDTWTNYEAFGAIGVPVFMVNSEADTVVNVKFVREVFARLKPGLAKREILFPKPEEISHVMLNKSRLKGFVKSPEVYNPHFEEILDQWSQFSRSLR